MVFLDSLIAYATAWLGAFSPAGWTLAPLSARRLLLLAVFPLFLLLQFIHACFLGLDHLFFPAFRAVGIRRPVFVLGIPRSGTTFLHRELARDSAFTAPATWEVLFAPSLCQRHIVAWLATLDRGLGRPLERLLSALLLRFGGEVDAVHPLGLRDAEEDYLALLPAGGCFFLSLAFPQARSFRHLAHLEHLPPGRRRRLLDHYHRILQRQVFFHGGAQLLSKNAVFASWAPYLADRYPDATLVFCIRHPGGAVASQLESLRSARALFGIYPADDSFETAFGDFYALWLEELRDCVLGGPCSPLVVEQEWLRGHGEQTLTMIYQRLQRERPGSARTREREVAASLEPGSVKRPIAPRVPWPLNPANLEPLLGPYHDLRAEALRQRGDGA